MLLDSTQVDHLRIDSGKRLSQIAATEVEPSTEPVGFSRSKTLPLIAQLPFNDDNSSAARDQPVATAACSSSELNFGEDNSIGVAASTSNLPITLRHSGQRMAPAIPRRSSKRNSARPISHSHARSPVKYRTSISSPKLERQPPAEIKTADAGARVQKQIDAMLAASNALKPGRNSTILQGPYVPMKKRRLKDNKVLTKVKTAINDRWQARTVKRNPRPRKGCSSYG